MVLQYSIKNANETPKQHLTLLKKRELYYIMINIYHSLTLFEKIVI